MPEEKTTEPVVDADAVKLAARREAVRVGLALMSETAWDRQVQMGYWPDDEEEVDYSTYFAEVHSKLSSAYEAYKETRDPRHLRWVDPVSGEEVPPGKGIPQGLAIDLMDMVFDLLGFMRNVGINGAEIGADMVMSMEAEDVVAGDFDIDSIFTEGEEPAAEAPVVVVPPAVEPTT